MTPTLRVLVLTTLCTLSVVGPSVAQEPPIASRTYLIGVRDQLQIQVEGLPDLDVDQPVAEDGTINIPVAGTVEARGLSTEALAVRVQRRLEERGLRDPKVNVKVTAFRSRPVSVLGAVQEPGNHYVAGHATLMEILLMAGGLTASHDRVIQIRRRSDNGLSDQIEISADDFESGTEVVHLPIFAGDYVNVPPAREIVVQFLGEVADPGNQVFRSYQRVTLLTALAQAGGLLETASKKLRIIRRSPNGQRQEIEANYRAILAGDAEDPPLQDGDLIVVKESFF